MSPSSSLTKECPNGWYDLHGASHCQYLARLGRLPFMDFLLFAKRRPSHFSSNTYLAW